MIKNNVLGKYANNVASQFGEDGVLKRIFEIIPEGNKWCVEFGAWDGKHLSNCYNLLSNDGWNGVMIEANSEKFKSLQQTYKGNSKTALINRFVSFEGNNSLDSILKETALPVDFDLLSIDIDGNDIYIWESLKKYEPKVVIIEFNPTIPSDIDFTQERDIKITQGSSLLSITKLGKLKGYELVATTACNGIYVKKQYYDLFALKDNSPGVLWDAEEVAPRLFQLYDGTIVLSKDFTLLWNEVKVGKFDLQKLPKFFRFFVDSQSVSGSFKKKLFKMYRNKINS